MTKLSLGNEVEKSNLSPFSVRIASFGGGDDVVAVDFLALAASEY